MLSFEPISAAQASFAVTWEYPEPYDIYNVPFGRRVVVAEDFLRAEYNYFAVLRDGEFIGFRCFGPDAQVPGGDYSSPALDMGGGLRPDLTGKGLGPSVMQAAIDFALTQYAPHVLRTTVAGFNGRAQRACEKVGYRKVDEFFSEKLGRDYFVFTRPAR